MNGATARWAIVTGGLLGAAAVAAGAFGAHGLRAVLEASGQAANWETAARYAVFHALALLATGLFAALPAAAQAGRMLAAATWCFAAGTIVFSGCLGVLAITGLRQLGAIVPVGGSLLVVGWVLVAVAGGRMGAGPRSPAER